MRDPPSEPLRPRIPPEPQGRGPSPPPRERWLRPQPRYPLRSQVDCRLLVDLLQAPSLTTPCPSPGVMPRPRSRLVPRRVARILSARLPPQTEDQQQPPSYRPRTHEPPSPSRSSPRWEQTRGAPSHLQPLHCPPTIALSTKRTTVENQMRERRRDLRRRRQLTSRCPGETAQRKPSSSRCRWDAGNPCPGDHRCRNSSTPSAWSWEPCST